VCTSDHSSIGRGRADGLLRGVLIRRDAAVGHPHDQEENSDRPKKRLHRVFGALKYLEAMFVNPGPRDAKCESQRAHLTDPMWDNAEVGA
jgi:hypothetical protein